MIGPFEVKFSHKGTRQFTLEVIRKKELVEDTYEQSFKFSWKRERATSHESLVAIVSGMIAYGAVLAVIHILGLSLYYLAVAAAFSLVVTYMVKTYLLYGSAVENREDVDVRN